MAYENTRPFRRWIVEQLAAGKSARAICDDLRVPRIKQDATEVFLQTAILAYADEPLAAEKFRRHAVEQARRPRVPFSIWLEERSYNGATAVQIFAALGLPWDANFTHGAVGRLRALWQLAASEGDQAWHQIDALRPGGLETRVRESTPQQRCVECIGTGEELASAISRSSRVLVLVGAGISASCGLPTFRDSGGFYDRVAKEFGMTSPEDINDIHAFQRDPRPWFRSVRDLVPTGTSEAPRPSRTHHFLRELERLGKLLRLYTQNIDTLEQVAGLSRVVYCHGSFATATCTGCGNKLHSHDATHINRTIAAGEVPRCSGCSEVVKPDVVLFNEPLPADFSDKIVEDIEEADLLLVMGTSLKVKPCSLIPHLVGLGSVQRVLINAEPAGTEGDFDGFLQGACDDVLEQISGLLGWSTSM